MNALARNLGSAIGSAVFGMFVATAAPTPATFTTLHILGDGTAILAAVAVSAIGRPYTHPSPQ